MSSLIDVLKGKIIPFASIVFYRPNVTLDDGDGYLAEFHKIKGGKMCAGRPLRIKEFTALLKKWKHSLKHKNMTMLKKPNRFVKE